VSKSRLTETVQVLGFSSASVASGNGTALIVGCGVNTLFDLHTTHFPAKIAPHISLSINGFVTETIVFFYICLNLFLRYL
ncbi:hypothetical protein, partial [Escherichia coli]|uniref:hypothetical protein n=10 Tax=Escherichia coli TaxID=562 RepID=UPI00195524FE